ncbi:MAG: hypothetical protein PVF82_21070 [Gammaproteobacteria bacterium]|jgi:hypothetical protein
MRAQNIFKFITFLMMAVFFIGCGGGGDGDNSTPPAMEKQQLTELTGVFVDGPVQNLVYKTATQSGKTDTNGRFLYVEGESITFSIGSVVLGSAPAAPVMTPMSLIPGASGPDDPAVINIVRLLLSIDSNQNTDDGIQLSDTSHTAANGLIIDFSLNPAQFSAREAVHTLVQSVRADGQLVDITVAQEHFNTTLSTSWGTMVWGQDCWQPSCE